MSHLLGTAALVLALAAPGWAVAGTTGPSRGGVTLPVHLAATSTPAPWFTSGIVAGRFGGIPVIGSYTGTSAIGIMTLTAHGATFAYGGYACLRTACTFTGSLAGIRVLRLPIPLNLRGAFRAPAQVFPTRVSWVQAVAGWARQHLAGDQRNRVVAEASKAPGS